MNSYRALKKQVFSIGEYSIVPIRMEDRYDIMKWRNEQIYHLRQKKILTKEEQGLYFNNVVSKLFNEDQPEQILFSYLEKNKCIGYGGLVHINWVDRNAEISFIMDTALEESLFEFHWTTYLNLIEQVAFRELDFHKIYTYAYDIRPQLYPALLKQGFMEDAVLKEHCLLNGKFIDVLIHAKINQHKHLRRVNLSDLEITFQWAVNPDIRRYSFNQNQITIEEHSNWFNSKLKSSNCYYYIMEIDNSPVGSIRFDVDQNEHAMISYLIDPVYHGKGLGKYILKFGVEQLLKDNSRIVAVYGYVMGKNIFSIRVFEKLGYKKIITENKQIRFEKEIS